MEAFSATLEELDSADLLVHVADASHPDLYQQIDSVTHILTQLGLDGMPGLLVLNKWDKVPEPAREDILKNIPDALPVSAETGFGLGRLLEVIEMQLLGQAPDLLPAVSDGPLALQDHDCVPDQCFPAQCPSYCEEDAFTDWPDEEDPDAPLVCSTASETGMSTDDMMYGDDSPAGSSGRARKKTR